MDKPRWSLLRGLLLLTTLTSLLFLLHQASRTYNYSVEKKGSPSDEKDLAADRKKFLEYRALRWINQESFHKYITSTDMVCKHHERAGNKGNGGWDVCLSGPYRLKSPCLVYSFGICYEFSFDDAIDQRFNCVVKSFDPSMTNVSNHRRGNHIYFFKEGIAGRDYIDDRGWQLYSFKTILEHQNDTNKVIDYFKMDIEWNEWHTLPAMAVSGVLRNIKQIGIEIHRNKGSLNAVHLINILEDHGFRKWKVHFNMACGYRTRGFQTSKCLELYYINTHFLDKESIGSFLAS